MTSSRVLALAAFAFVVSCGDSNGPSGNSGTASFNYSGAITGSFEAEGAPPVLQPEGAEFAAGFRSDQDQVVGVVAVVPRNSTNSDVLIIQIPRLTAGSSTILDTCTADNCAAVLFSYNANNDSGEAQWSCGLLSGTITITSITSDRVEGTFSGTGECLGTGPTPSAFTITNGSFDVRLLSNLGF